MNLTEIDLGFIGAGNMGAAILEGLLSKKLADPSRVYICDKDTVKTAALKCKWRINVSCNVRELASSAEVILLAIKPQDLGSVAEEMSSSLRPRHILISILAGLSRAKLRNALGEDALLVRAMPNLGALAGESMTVITGGGDKALLAAETLFGACGRTARLDESYFDLVTALSGSGPAYFFLVMEMMTAKGIERGLTLETARLLAVQTAQGAACVAQSSNYSPAELRSMVTSKGGTTEAALKVLEESNFSETFSKALDAAERRGRELRGES